MRALEGLNKVSNRGKRKLDFAGRKDKDLWVQEREERKLNSALWWMVKADVRRR